MQPVSDENRFGPAKGYGFMKRKSFEGAACPVARSLEEIGDWWSLLIVRDALFGKRRFGEFQKSLGLARNILAVRLRKLVAHGVLEVGNAEGSAYPEYRLTEKGKGLYLVLVALRQWGEANFYKDEPIRVELLDREGNAPVRRLELRAADGRLLGPEDFYLIWGDEPSPHS